MEAEAAGFARSSFSVPYAAERIRSSGSLAGGAGPCCVAGEVTYRFQIPEPGWYELSARGRALEIEFSVTQPEAATAYRFPGGTDNVVDGLDRVGNVWLERGAADVRLSKWYWTGFPAVTGIRLDRSAAGPRSAVTASFRELDAVFREGRCEPLRVLAGGTGIAGTLDVLFLDAAGAPKTRRETPVPASARPVAVDVPVPCQEGAYMAAFGWNGSPTSWRDARGVRFEVVRANPAPAGARLVPIEVIDATTRAPDYASGPTSVVRNGALAYREGGDTGFTRYQRAPAAARGLMPEPAWFAYTLRGLTPQAPHVVEIDYPDDAERTLVFALREDSPLDYPVSGGADTGGEFALSDAMQTRTLLFWPRSTGVRLLALTAHDGRRVTLARIRIHRVEGPLPGLDQARPATREVVHWFEEGMSFTSQFGMRDPWKPAALTEAAARWAEAARASGYTTLMPTVAIYGFGLFPSRIARAFSRPDSDVLRRILLAAEAQGLSVVPELHPRGDELDWDFLDVPDPKPHLLLSRHGRTSYYQGDGPARNLPPYFNPLHPAVRAWYAALVTELAERYRDSPAFAGVSLRQMDWANPALVNFQSAEWGYDDLTLRTFQAETGIALPATIAPGAGPAPRLAKARHEWLMAGAREAWLDWRCRKVAELHGELVARLRAVRPDLKLHATLFAFGSTDADRLAWREAGIDPARLAAIDGLVVMNALGAYGRREPDALANQRARFRAVGPGPLRQALAADGTGRFLTYAHYVEATEAVAPPARLGFPASTKQTWTSAAVVPAGRHALERYAAQLAETDARMLGDGGNGYAIPEPTVREWLGEYRLLPAVPFESRPEAADPVAIRTARVGDRLWIYAVNRDRHPAEATLSLVGARRVIRPATGAEVAAPSGQVTLVLEPYALVVLTTEAGATLAGTRVSAAPAGLAQVRAQVDWITELARGAGASPGLYGLSSDQGRVLAATAAAAAGALGAGRPWRARMALEDPSFVALLPKLRTTPPQFRNVRMVK
jgi:hypothetical protein